MSLSSDPEWNFNDDGTIWTENSDGSYNGTLKVGATATYEAFYTIKQPAIDLGGLEIRLKFMPTLQLVIPFSMIVMMEMMMMEI